LEQQSKNSQYLESDGAIEGEEVSLEQETFALALRVEQLMVAHESESRYL